METYTRQQFFDACRELIGDEMYSRMELRAKYNVDDWCHHIATSLLLNELHSSDTKTLRIIQVTAYRLWRETGCHGLLE